MAEVRKRFEVVYSDEADEFYLFDRATRELAFVAPGIAKVYPLHRVGSTPGEKRVMAPRMVDQVLASIDNIKGGVMDLHARLLHAPVQLMKSALEFGHYGDVISNESPPTEAEWREVQECLICARYKDTRIRGEQHGSSRTAPRPRKGNKVGSPAWSLPMGPVDVTVTMDVVNVVKGLSLTAVVRPIGYKIERWVESHETEDLIQGCVLITSQVKAAAGVNKITSVEFDCEVGINADDFLTATGVPLRRSIPHVHNQTVEGNVRSLRNQWRTQLGRVGDAGVMPISQQTVRAAWEHTVRASNFVPGSGSSPYLPHQLMFWENDTNLKKVVLEPPGPKYHTPPGFGEFVLVNKGETPLNKTEPRRSVAMIVGFEPMTRAVWVRFPSSHRPVMRDAYRAVSDDVGKQLWDQAKNPVPFVTGENNPLVDPDDEGVFVPGIATTADTTQDLEIRGEQRDVEEEDETQPRRSGRTKKPKIYPDHVQAIEEDYALTFREKVAKVGGQGSVSMDEPIHVTLERLELVCAAVECDASLSEDELEKRATEDSNEGKSAAALLELKRIYQKFKAFELMPNDVDLGELKTIRGRLIGSVKYDANGVFRKYKERLVAQAHLRKDKPTEILDTFSPTFAHPSFLLALNLALALDLCWAHDDVTSAYLHADFTGDVYMKLDSHIVDYLEAIDATVAKSRREDGSVLVKLKKALYGLQESANLWYKTVSEALREMGFTPSNYDRCFFYQWKDGKLSVVVLYVDDIFTCAPREHIEMWRTKLGEKFHMSRAPINPKSFTYVGITTEYDEHDQAFLLSQPAFVDKIIQQVEGEEELPYKPSMDIYKETDPEPIPDASKYRSMVMQLQYAARVRLDLKPLLVYLTTRMQAPTRGDVSKMEMGFKYLRKTKNLKLRYKPSEGHLQVNASADASFAPFPDGKSVSGMVVTVGGENAPILAKSGKQKSVANSSTAAELVALASVMEEVLWTVELLNEIGLKQGPVVISQDNKSTITLAQKGPSGEGRTKWMNVKSFWVSEHLADGTVVLKYTPSEEIVADGFTKLLGGKRFKLWRAKVLNLKDSHGIVRENE